MLCEQRGIQSAKYNLYYMYKHKNALPIDEDDAVGVVVDDGARLTNTNTNTNTKYKIRIHAH